MLDFPNNPAVGDNFRNWTWDGRKWVIGGETDGDFDPNNFVWKTGDTMTGSLQITGQDNDLTVGDAPDEQTKIINAGLVIEKDGKRIWSATGDENTFGILRYDANGDPIDTPLNLQADGSVKLNGLQLPGRPNTPLDIANDQQLCAHTPNKIIDTTALRIALQMKDDVQRPGESASPGWPYFQPNFNRQVNFAFYASSSFTWVFPEPEMYGAEYDVTNIVGRSGLIAILSLSPLYQSWNVPPNGQRWTFDRMLAPNYATSGWNLYSYAIWNPARIQINLIGAGLG